MKSEMRTVAFLQNQWFREPERIKAKYDRLCGDDLGKRCDLDSIFLFMGCLTGRQLKAAFGMDGGEIRQSIVWANASPQIGGESSSSFPADPAHMLKIVQHYKPTVILTFGKIAADGVLAMMQAVHLQGLDCPSFKCIGGPHPAARQGDIVAKLRSVAAEWKAFMEAEGHIESL